MALLPVAEAFARLTQGAGRLGTETVPLSAAAGRILAAPVAARRTQPPFPLSAMDGYAVRARDIATAPARLSLIGEAVAGRGFAGRVGPGEAVRIFTGAPVPDGADAILIQENARAEGATIVALEPVAAGRHVRPAGLDFREGEILIPEGLRLDFRGLALAAAMNATELAVARRPRVAILATGDELVMPGEIPGSDQIVASNSLGIAALVAAEGGEPIDLGIAPDRAEAIAARVVAGLDQKIDVLVTLGGASVGDHDLIRPALGSQGLDLGFWRIAMRPGKPLLFGRLGATRVLGLPGNPVSSLVCGLLFLAPLLGRLQGRPTDLPAGEPAVLGAPLAQNDERQDYLRARLGRDENGRLVATPFDRQDSSMLRTLAQAAGLIVRAPHAPAAEAGDPCRVIRLGSPDLSHGEGGSIV